MVDLGLELQVGLRTAQKRVGRAAADFSSEAFVSAVSEGSGCRTALAGGDFGRPAAVDF